jgi:hypothetical protein
MRAPRTDPNRAKSAPRDLAAKPLKRLPERATTKQMHESLLRTLGRDRRVKRAFD